ALLQVVRTRRAVRSRAEVLARLEDETALVRRGGAVGLVGALEGDPRQAGGSAGERAGARALAEGRREAAVGEGATVGCGRVRAAGLVRPAVDALGHARVDLDAEAERTRARGVR